MARSSAQVVQIKGFSGGISDDRFTGVRDSFQSSKSVEIRRFPDSLKLARLVERQATALGAIVKRIVTLQTSGDDIAFLSNGAVYRRAFGGTTWATVSYTAPASVLGALEYNGYLYFATASNLHRIAVADAASADWTGDVTENYKAFNNANANVHPMIEVYNKLYVGDGSSLAELDSSAVWTSQVIRIFGDEEIVSLTFSGSMMRVYARKTAKVDYGRAYLWDATSDAYNEFVSWEGLTIWSAINKDGIDYVVAGKRPAIYSSSGYQRQLLKRFGGVTSALPINPYATTIFDDFLTIGVAASGADAYSRGGYTWGRLTENYNESLNFDFPLSSDSTTAEIGCVHSSGGQLLIGLDGAIDVVKNDKYAATGYVISRVYTGGTPGLQKILKQIDIAYAPLSVGEAITIDVRRDSGAWETALAVSYADDAGTVNRRSDMDALGEFSHIEFRITLQSGTSNATTPELFDMNAVYEFIKLD